uniref:Secreted protein n=1 Tax=Steinernema glaseri TaxID=37863 RepID=A0A1I8ASE8_9BILA
MFVRCALFGLCFAAIASSSKVQKFIPNSDWDACFAFVQNASRTDQFGFASLEECFQVAKTMTMGGKICTGPFDNVVPKPKKGSDLHPGQTCAELTCPEKTHHCVQGMVAVCCNKENEKLKEQGLSDKCPNGAKAAGVGKGKEFHALAGKTCDDLICGKSEKCIQVNKFFAKCCGAK